MRRNPSVCSRPHQHVPHEVVTLRALLVGFEPFGALEIFDCVDGACDTRVEIGRARSLGLFAEAAAGSDYDVAVMDLSREDSPGLEVLARPEFSESPIPIVLIIHRAQEEQILHLGWRDYLVYSQITPRLLVRTLRFAVERHALEHELAEAQARERFHATRDHMTELPNRSHFHEELKRALDRASRGSGQVAVLFTDLDRFKQINDTFGHEVGDSLITAMAARLSSVLRKSDLVARVGGDEFVLMLQGSDLEFAPAVVAAKILDVVAQPFIIGEDEHSVSASVGIAVFPRDGTDPGALIRNADAAMYQAKATGRNSYQFYSQSMNAVARRRLKVESKLRRAVERDELEIYYQPRVDVGSWRDHQCRGATALERSRAGNHLAGRVRSDRRGLGPDRADRSVGAASCLPRTRTLGRGRARRCALLGQSVEPADPPGHAAPERRRRALGSTTSILRMLEVEITETALIENQEVAAAGADRADGHGHERRTRRLRDRLLVAQLPQALSRSTRSRSTSPSCATS